MSGNEYRGTERAERVLWIAKEYGKTAVQRQLMEKYEKSLPERSMIREWYRLAAAYQLK